MVSVPARRGQVVYATGRGLSQRRACTLVQVGRSALQLSIAEGGQERGGDRTDARAFGAVSRFGSRRVRIFLGRAGFAISPGRRIGYGVSAKLQVPRRRRESGV